MRGVGSSAWIKHHQVIHSGSSLEIRQRYGGGHELRATLKRPSIQVPHFRSDAWPVTMLLRQTIFMLWLCLFTAM